MSKRPRASVEGSSSRASGLVVRPLHDDRAQREVRLHPHRNVAGVVAEPHPELAGVQLPGELGAQPDLHRLALAQGVFDRSASLHLGEPPEQLGPGEDGDGERVPVCQTRGAEQEHRRGDVHRAGRHVGLTSRAGDSPSTCRNTWAFPSPRSKSIRSRRRFRFSSGVHLQASRLAARRVPPGDDLCRASGTRRGQTGRW